MTWAGFVLWLHVLAAIFWVGGQLFLVMVVLPVLRQSLPEGERARIAGRMGRRFALFSSAALGVLLVTGPLNAVAHGVSWTIVRDTEWGRVLLVKVTLVLAVLVISTVHGAYYGRRLECLADSCPGDLASVATRHRLHRQSVRFSTVNLGLNVVIVGLAVWLATLP